jgi:hypothetical protein
MANKSALALLYAALGVVIYVFLRETSWSVIVDFTMDQLAVFFAVERAKMIANAAPYVITVLLAGFLLAIAYQLGSHERASFRPEADIDADKAFDLVLKRSKWAKHHAKNWQALPKVMYERDRPEPTVIEERLQAQFHRELHNLLRDENEKIICWGHESLSSAGARLTPQKKIETWLWDKMEIRLISHQYCAVHEVGDRSGQLAFVGLRFSKKQIQKQFPLAWWSR